MVNQPHGRGVEEDGQQAWPVLGVKSGVTTSVLRSGVRITKETIISTVHDVPPQVLAPTPYCSLFLQPHIFPTDHGFYSVHNKGG